jgi:sugar phosphate permease
MQDAMQTAGIELALTQRPTRVRHLVLVLVALASSSAYLTRHSIAVANTKIQEDLRFTDAQMGWVLGAFSYGYLIFQVPGGWLGNRFGTRAALTGLSVVWSGLTIATGASTTFLHMFSTRFVFGSAQAGLVPNSGKVLKDWIPIHRRGIASALVGASMSVGGAFTLYLTGKLIGILHWRMIFFSYSAVGMVWALFFYWWFRTQPEEHPWVNAEEIALIRTDTESVDAAASSSTDESAKVSNDDASGPPLFLLLSEMFRHRSTWAICSQSFFRAAAYAFYVTWLPAFLIYRFEVTPENAGTMSSWPVLLVVPGSISGGFLVDYLLRRTGRRWVSRSGLACVALVVAGAATLMATRTTTLRPFVAFMAMGGLFSGIAGPAVWAATIDIAGKRTAVVMAVMNTAGCFIGFVTTYVGYMVERIKKTDGDWNQVIYLHVAFFFAAAFWLLLVNPDDDVTAGAEPALAVNGVAIPPRA